MRRFAASTAILRYPPDERAISATQAKQWLKVMYSEEDEIIEALIDAAVSHCETYTGIAMAAQDVEEYFEPPKSGQSLMLSMWPVSEVTAIIYTDKDGDEVETDSDFRAAGFEIDLSMRPAAITAPDGWPETLEGRSLSVKYTCEYPEGASYPPQMKVAALRHLADHFDNRADFHQRFRAASEVLLDPLRLRVIAE
jgi:uncharacterized phiE125 gp8 family phage protein